MDSHAPEKLDRIATEYDSEKDFDFHLIRFGYARIRKRLKAGRVLEMGCASGVMTRLLVKDAAKLEVVDGSRTYLDQLARDPALAEVVLHQSLFEEFKPEGRFSDIVMARALEHLEDPVGMLRKTAGWLEPGGKLHIVVPNADSLHRRLGVAMGMLNKTDDLSERDRRFGHHRVYRRALLVEHLSAAGFRVLHSEGVFLKPLSNRQMENWDETLLSAFDRIGNELPDWCAEIYVTAETGDF